jgi:uncharacterized protein (DUF1697 family)
MAKYVALLRAINVGGHTVKMDSLRLLFEALGFSNVETFIASGNVIFDSTSKSSKALEKKIENYLQERLGYAVATFVRTTAELLAAAQCNPFDTEELKPDGSTLYVAFLADTPSDEATLKLLSLATEIDKFHVVGREVYWLCRTKFSESNFSGARLEKTLKLPATLRNVTTVRKMAAKYS